jgi:hypothetical protein
LKRKNPNNRYSESNAKKSSVEGERVTTEEMEI